MRIILAVCDRCRTITIVQEHIYPSECLQQLAFAPCKGTVTVIGTTTILPL